ncbi:hypothetical protein OK18_00885 [Chryseobacterium gallinarum]|uniref:Uncharacterized protein n=1 Tax=Chryseobacterium gallinarum TaxID=1324352 RepID=A0A0G3LXL6_CHRGL|nr:hypothetical protein [Chryseobacterium gallinarum]AKK71384.1 hypothetical protein OK18_00885 [Chryseobacterium gallinarum]
MNINLIELETEKHHFLTPAAGTNFGHAASICLESQGHDISVDIAGEGHYCKIYKTIRYDVNNQMKRTWGDEEYTTEQGAYGVALLVASAEMNVKAIEKSRKKTGIDYWLGTEDNDFLFQRKVRLEVSGIRNGTDYQLNQRFDNKMEQSEKSDTTKLPALIVVVEFSSPRIKTGLRNIL